MNEQINDYVPFMDKYPELKLRPVTEFPNHPKISNYDYVQDLRLKGKKAPQGYFYFTVKDEKYGIYMFDRGLFDNTTSVVLTPEYERIEVLFYDSRTIGVIVKKNGKYGLFYWTYGFFSNDTTVIRCEYDSFERIEGGRYKAVKDNTVTYFDASAHVLK